VFRTLVVAFVAVALSPAGAQQRSTSPVPDDDAACRGLLDLPTLTITTAVVRPATAAAPAHCYMRGTIAGRIGFHVQLPLRSAWNGRLLNIGDGGKDGVLNRADHRLAQGYVVANSNSGHDAASEPGSTFGLRVDAIEDFGHRAVHLTAVTSKAIVRAYYGRPAEYTYFEGCSTGGRQGLMEAQRYPDDFDGIVAGDPGFDNGNVHASHVWFGQQMFKDGFAANLAFDKDGDGTLESLTKLELLRKAVLARCDAIDGITDDVVDDPRACRFDPETALASLMCPGDVNGDACFTRRQVQAIAGLYRGPHDSRGRRIRAGVPVGSEFDWDNQRVPHAGNNLSPTITDHVNFLFFRQSPGVPPPVLTDITYRLDRTSTPPEYAWWEFDVDAVTAGEGAFMATMMDATETDLSRFLKRNGGKLLLYHGWGDSGITPEPTIDYYNDVIAKTFNGDAGTARQAIRLFMVPGMGHCNGGPGCTEWDRLAPLVAWVERGEAPDYVVAEHRTDGKVDNQRRICAYPQRAVYVGPAGGQNARANWIEKNFACR
jgi:feruloyl esterase